MKLDDLIHGLENIKAGNDSEGWDADLVRIAIIELLVRFINHPRVEEKINEIHF